MTDLQVRAWTEWLTMDIRRPGKPELYAAQTACEVRRSWVKTPSSINPGDFLMRDLLNPLEEKGGEGGGNNTADADDSLEAEKRAVMGAFGGKGRYTPPPPKVIDPPDEDQWVDDPWERSGNRRMEDDG